MLLYCTPGGTWAGNEADYKKALKAEGIDPKSVNRKQVEVPVKKADLLEFLTFHGVNPIGGRAPQVTGGEAPPTPLASPPVAPAAPAVSSASVADQVEALPITAQIDILVGIADRAHKAIYKTI